jgi:hypothetical protein
MIDALMNPVPLMNGGGDPGLATYQTCATTMEVPKMGKEPGSQRFILSPTASCPMINEHLRFQGKATSD